MREQEKIPVSGTLELQILSFHHESLRTSQLETSGRSSLVLRLETEAGVFLGEASPLVGYGVDSFELAEEELRAIRCDELLDAVALITQSERFLELESGSPVRHQGRDSVWIDGSGSPLSILEAIGKRCSSPSARFCVETAVLSAASSLIRVFPHRLLKSFPQALEFGTSAVIDPLSEGALARIQELAELGVRTVKLKCGRDEKREVAFLAVLSQLAPLLSSSSFAVRLDPNRAWHPTNVERFVEACGSLNLEWIEDPTSTLSEWPLLTRSHPSLCLAIDEPLAGVAPEGKLLKESGAGVVVLKPMALGGFSQAARWSLLAEEQGLSVSVSHLFDGPIAFEATVQLAFCAQSPHLVPGLGRHLALGAFGEKFSQPPSLLGSQLKSV